MRTRFNEWPQPSALLFKWTTSRARASDGWNICSLWIHDQKEASTCGGGYDMKGTALGSFIEKQYMDRLLKLHRRAGTRYSIAPEGSPAAKVGKAYKRLTTYDRPGRSRPWSDHGEFYGLTAYYRRGESKPYKMSMDGGCGFSCMVDIGRAVGLSFRFQHEKSNEILYTMTDKKAEA